MLPDLSSTQCGLLSFVWKKLFFPFFLLFAQKKEAKKKAAKSKCSAGFDKAHAQVT